MVLNIRRSKSSNPNIVQAYPDSGIGLVHPAQLIFRFIEEQGGYLAL
jgi:hypothetical protein